MGSVVCCQFCKICGLAFSEMEQTWSLFCAHDVSDEVVSFHHGIHGSVHFIVGDELEWFSTLSVNGEVDNPVTPFAYASAITVAVGQECEAVRFSGKKFVIDEDKFQQFVDRNSFFVTNKRQNEFLEKALLVSKCLKEMGEMLGKPVSGYYSEVPNYAFLNAMISSIK